MDTTEVETQTFFRGIRQGTVLTLPHGSSELFACFPPGTIRTVVVSQTCDVVLPKRPTVILAPVVSLQGDESRLAIRRESPRYIHLPNLSGDWFGDLSYLHAFDKSALTNLHHTPGIDTKDDEAVRACAQAIGRWFSRFPIPDDIVPWLNPLLAVVRQKYRKPASSLGRVLHDIAEIRIEADKWSARPLDLTLHVIVKAGVIPTLSDDEIDRPTMLRAFSSHGEIGKPSQIADMLIGATMDREKATLWPLLAESMAAVCHPPETQMPGLQAVGIRAIVAELWEDDQFTLSHVRKSELLDVEFLSEAYPQ